MRAAPFEPDVADVPFTPDVEIALRALRTTAQLLPGSPTEVWTLRGDVLAGSDAALAELESGALGPTFHVRRGEKVRITFDNQLPEPSILHWHGLSVPPSMDGHPRYAIETGRQYVYEFEVRNAAGTYWYHAHPHRRVGLQVCRGMAGLFIVHDADDDALPLPRGELDLPIVIQDRSFDADNQFSYAPSPMEAMTGYLGDRVLINGSVEPLLRVATRPYRLRLLNGSNSRIYRLAWSDGSPLIVIGTDGGLLARPVQRTSVMLGPGERLELWADFGGRPSGSQLSLVSLAFDPGSGMGGMAAGLRQGAPLTLLALKMEQPSRDAPPLSRTLIPAARYRDADAVNAAAPRRIVPTLQHMAWGLNGRSFELERVADDERTTLGELEVWEFDNRGAGSAAMAGGMAMSMPHPMHLHGAQFQVAARHGVTHDGYVDEGWKDTLLVMPGETARILVRQQDYTGTYLYHCHNLEHEDGGMMRNFVVES